MNVIIFVITILLAIAALTYARLDSFRYRQTIQPPLMKYMTQEERDLINQAAEKAYDEIKVAKKKTEEKNSPVQATAKVNISLLLDPEKRNKQPNEWKQTQILLHALIDYLYRDQPFYRKLEAEYPEFVNDLLNEISAKIEHLPRDKRPKEPKDLANLTLPTPQLDDMLYKILHGTICPGEQASNVASPSIEIATQQSEEESEGEAPTYQSPKGYCSLLDFVSRSSHNKIRVYLAPKPVLVSIFGDEKIADSIINERYDLYQRARKGEDTKELSKAFKATFDRSRNPAIDENMVDYSVSKTKPKS